MLFTFLRAAGESPFSGPDGPIDGGDGHGNGERDADVPSAKDKALPFADPFHDDWAHW